MVVEEEDGCWAEVEPWWETFLGGSSTVLQPRVASVTDTEEITGNWNGIDEWWESHIESQRGALLELQSTLEETQTVWDNSESRFDSDPLTVDWASRNQVTGPLRTHQEENWSQWLAHLIRAGPPEFSSALFGAEFDAVPRSVEREVHLPAHNDPDRYADILSFYDGQAVSIEVKKGDEHYDKTIHTASLLESQFRETWQHVLLLPVRKEGALRQSFPDRLSEDGDALMIKSGQSTEIAVMHWVDVGRSIRQVVLSNIDTSDHWEASAYLFCTVIEQQLARFVPKPVIDRIFTSKDINRTTPSVRITPQRIDDQIAYLRETTSTLES